MQTSLESAPAATADRDLLARYAASGDDAAFAELVRRHLPLVLAVTRRRLGSSGLAEDAAQQVFIALSSRARRLGGIPCLPAWLQKAAVYEAANLARRESRHQRRAMAAGELQAPAEEDRDGGQLDRALAALPERDRQVLLLHHFEKLAYDQVARRLGINAEAAQRRGHRALEKLRALLQRQGISRDGAACALWIGAGLAPAALKVPHGFVEKTASLKKAASSALPWLPLAAIVVLGGGTWAVVQASKPAAMPVPVLPVTAASTAERPAPRKRAALKPDSELNDELREFIALAKRDSAQAWAWVKERDDWKEFIADAMPFLDERDPAAAERFLAALDSRESRTETITAIFDARAAANFESAVVWIDAFDQSFERQGVRSLRHGYFANEELDHDYQGALKLAHSPEVRRWLIGEACEKYAALDETKIEAMAATLQGEEKQLALGWTASLLLQRGDPRAFEVMEGLKLDRNTFPESRPLAMRDPRVVVEWMIRRDDSEDSCRMARDIWRDWAQRDAPAAAAWALEENAKITASLKKFRAHDGTSVNRLMKEKQP